MKRFLKRSIEIVLELSVVVAGREIGKHFFMNDISKVQFSNIFVCGGLSAIAMMFLIDIFSKSNENKKS